MSVFPIPCRVHELVLDQALRRPHATAVVCGDRRWSYAHTATQVRAIAGGLAARGIGQGDLVGICLSRSPEMVAVVLGVLAAGAGYLPLDPADPLERRTTMLADGSPALLVVDDAAGEVPAGATTPAALAAANDGLALPAVGAHDIAYVIYTSGSTGHPKGVVMRHGAIDTLVRWQIDSTAHHRTLAGLSKDAAPACLQYTPLTFDVSFLEILSTLGAGRTLVVPPEVQRRDLSALLDLVIAERVGSIFLPLTVLNQLAAFATRRRLFPATLFEVMTGGEQLRITPAIAGWFVGMPGCTLQNIYGPTEAHVVTTYALRDDPARWPALPPVGLPVDGATIHLLDDMLRPVPHGEVGEICIGGVSLAQGYLRRPDLTAERFVDGPPGTGRLYRTGDLGHRRADGELVYDGRVDDQVKIQGVRLELREVEHQLEQHPDVRQCAVVAREAEGGKQLVAYVLPREGPAATADWRGFLTDRLPPAAVPGTYVVLDAMPLTSSGKVDRHALPSPSRGRPALAQAFVAPRTELEACIAAVWRQHLQLDEVGIDDRFFELGGRSLTLVQVQNALSGVLGREVSLAALLQHPTVRALAVALTPFDTPDTTGTDNARRRRRQDALGRRGPTLGAARLIDQE